MTYPQGVLEKPRRPEQREETAAPLRRAYSRRAFLERAALGASLGFTGLLAACGGGEEGGGEEVGTPEEPAASVAEIQASECAGYDALTERELQTRQALGYVDNSPYPEQLCSNCQFYNQPEGDSPCGGCQLFAGPVAPGGYCNSWVIAADAGSV